MGPKVSMVTLLTKRRRFLYSLLLTLNNDDPAGSDVADLTRTGKAKCGLTAKYRKRVDK